MGPTGGARPRRFLTPQEKYEIWLQLVRDESLIAHAADQAVVDRSTIMKLRAVAKQGALNALGRVTAGVRQRKGPDPGAGRGAGRGSSGCRGR